MKFGQFIKHKKIFFFKNHVENEVGRIVPDSFFFFQKKAYIKEKQVVCSLTSVYFDSPQLGIQ